MWWPNVGAVAEECGMAMCEMFGMPASSSHNLSLPSGSYILLQAQSRLCQASQQTLHRAIADQLHTHISHRETLPRRKHTKRAKKPSFLRAEGVVALIRDRCVARGFSSEPRGCSASEILGGDGDWYNECAKQASKSDVISILRFSCSSPNRSKTPASQ